jgi:hypothetical protein
MEVQQQSFDFDIFELLSQCKPIRSTGRYKSSVFKEPPYFVEACFLGDLFGNNYMRRYNEHRYSKTYYINTHQLVPYNYFEKIENQTKDICLSRVKKNGKELKYIAFQSLEVCIEAVKQNVYAFDFVDTTLQLYPLYQIIEHKNQTYFNSLLKRKNKTIIDLKLEYYCMYCLCRFDEKYMLNKDVWLVIISYI